MQVFSAGEVLQFAIRIEENGEAFYGHASKISDDEKSRETFDYLREQEVKHKELFQTMVSHVEKYEPPESYPGEYFAYLRAYVERIVFDPEKMEDKLSSIKDTGSAIDFGIQRELDAILYFYEIKKLVPASQHGTIDSVINEEIGHFANLTRLKNQQRVK